MFVFGVKKVREPGCGNNPRCTWIPILLIEEQSKRQTKTFFYLLWAAVAFSKFSMIYLL